MPWYLPLSSPTSNSLLMMVLKYIMNPPCCLCCHHSSPSCRLLPGPLHCLNGCPGICCSAFPYVVLMTATVILPARLILSLSCLMSCYDLLLLKLKPKSYMWFFFSPLRNAFLNTMDQACPLSSILYLPYIMVLVNQAPWKEGLLPFFKKIAKSPVPVPATQPLFNKSNVGKWMTLKELRWIGHMGHWVHLVNSLVVQLVTISCIS